jgi:hypothetical protein
VNVVFEEMSDTLVVAAIDFGTTFSSWGFSFKHEFDLDPTKVTAKQWSGLESTISLKGKSIRCHEQREYSLNVHKIISI